MEILNIILNDDVDAYLSEVITQLRGDPISIGLVAVLLKADNSIPEIGQAGADLVHMGLYPEKEKNWDYAIPLKNDFIFVNQLLADELNKGGILLLRAVGKPNGRDKSQIFLRPVGGHK